MACKKCKDKRVIEEKLVVKDSLKKQAKSINKLYGMFIFIWFLLGLYGLYSLIIGIIHSL